MRWIYHVFTLEIRKVIAYRIDFWFQFIMSIFANVATAYFLWKAIFEYKQISELNGYSFLGLMLYYLMVPMIARMINGPGLGMIAQEIYDGSLTKYLIYPVSFFKYKYTQYLADTTVYFSQFILGIVIFLSLFGFPQETNFSFYSVATGTISILAAGIMAFSLSVLLEMTAFWADNVWSLLVMVRFCVGLLGGSLIPISFFPQTFQSILNLLPFSYLASFPIECFTGKVPFSAWLFGMTVVIFWFLLFSSLSFAFWNLGKQKYTGVGI